jgi:two-component system chemotaxis response regulator CheB
MFTGKDGFMIRVLIADDSATARQLLSYILAGASDIQVVGEAVNGEEAVRKAGILRPNLILMDIHMPVMDGLQATQQIMMNTPTPIVLVSASTMVHETETAMLALRAGALTLLLKPAGPVDPNHEQACRELVNTVRAMADVKVVRHHRTSVPVVVSRPLKTAPPTSTDSTAIKICAVATSTGGPPALQKIFGAVPGDFPMPIVVVQHIAKGFTEGLAEWMDSNLALTVKVAKNGERLLPGTMYFAPDDHHLGVGRDGTARLSDAPPIGGFRPSGTHLFRSVAESYGSRTLALILTGMGCDGVEGLRNIREVGGTIFAQDEATCVVNGMPGAAVAAGLADQVVPLDRMAQAVLARTTGNTFPANSAKGSPPK